MDIRTVGSTLLVCGALVASAGTSLNDGILTFDTSDGDITYSNALGADIQKVIKTGDGTVTLNTASPNFPSSSTVEIQKGTMTLKHTDVFGPSAGVTAGPIAAITIKEGASLFLNVQPRTASDNTSPMFANHPITVGGDGVNHTGAIRFTPSSGGELCDGLLSQLTLTSDATIANTVRMGFVPMEDLDPKSNKASYTFDLGGHTLTLAGTQGVFLHKLTLKNGNVKINAGTKLTCESNQVFLDPDYPGQIIMNGGEFWFAQTPPVDTWGKNWKFVYTASSTLAATQTLNNKFAGDVEFSNWTNTVTARASGSLMLNGGVYSGRQTYFGTDTAGEGEITFKNATVSNDWIIGRGTSTKFSGGSMVLDRLDIGSYSLNGATNVFCDGVSVRIKNTFATDSPYWQVQPRNQLGALVFKDCTVSTGGSTAKQIRMSIDFPETKGLVRIENGASVDLSFGTIASRGRALVVQNGGVVTNNCQLNMGGKSWIGNVSVKGRGYYELNGGSYVFNKGHVRLGDNGSGGRGFFVQRGGVLRYRSTANASFVLHSTGYGEYSVLGGEFVADFASGELQLSSSGNESDIRDGSAGGMLTLSGPNSAFRTRDWLATFSTNTSDTVINIRDGATLEAQALKIRTAQGASATDYPGMRTYLNLDGGVVRPFAGESSFVTSTRKPNAVTLYDGGVVFDTSIHTNASGAYADFAFGAPIAKATGKGIATITLPTSEAFLREEYLSPGRIHISSAGTGRYATAIADYDGNALKLKNVIVTSPGCDYEEGTTVVEIESATNNNYRFACAFTLKDNTGKGGIVKRGSGRMTMGADDDVAGDLQIEGGALKFPGNLPLAGRKIRMTCAAVFGDGVLECAGVLDLTGAIFEIVDPENLPLYEKNKRTICLTGATVIGLPTLAADYGNFGLKVTGKGIAFGYRPGLALIVR